MTHRFHYTISGTRPVDCTIIGDDPAFFMSADIAKDADLDLTPQEAETVEDALSVMSGWLFLPDRVEKPASPQNLPDLFDLPDLDIFDLITLLEKSGYGRALLDTGVKLKLCRGERGAFFKDKTVYLNPHLSLADAALLAAPMIKRAVQDHIHPLHFEPNHSVLINRVIEADRAVVMVRLAWELMLADETACWETLLSSGMDDLCRAFTTPATRDFRNLKNGFAPSGVFETWFLSDRVNHYDRILVKQMMVDPCGYVFGEHKYRTDVAQSILSICADPHEKNYISKHINMVIDDPVFTEVRDRGAHNHIWFVKFENSWRREMHQVKEPEPEPDLENVISFTPPQVNSPSQEQEGKILLFKKRVYAGRLYTGWPDGGDAA